MTHPPAMPTDTPFDNSATLTGCFLIILHEFQAVFNTFELIKIDTPTWHTHLPRPLTHPLTHLPRDEQAVLTRARKLSFLHQASSLSFGFYWAQAWAYSVNQSIRNFELPQKLGFTVFVASKLCIWQKFWNIFTKSKVLKLQKSYATFFGVGKSFWLNGELKLELDSSSRA